MPMSRQANIARCRNICLQSFLHKTYRQMMLRLTCTVLFFAIAQLAAANVSSDTSRKKVKYINTAFENASQANWNIDSNGVVVIEMIYDHERNSVNRANGHWHFQVE